MVRRGQCRVLVVEDYAPVRRLIALWLRRDGFVALEADNASQALLHFRRKPESIHLAIIDLVGTSGLDLAVQIHRDYQNTQILYISGFVESVAVEAIGRRSPESLLLKPFGERLLLDRVYSLLGRRLPANGPKLGPRSEGEAAPKRRYFG